MNISPPLFELGRVVATPGALRLLVEVGLHPYELLTRHVTGDYGDMCVEDTQTNTEAIACRERIFSSYPVGPSPIEAGWKVWVITDAGWQTTTLLLPEEY